jgi:hypothetical protein
MICYLLPWLSVDDPPQGGFLGLLQKQLVLMEYAAADWHAIDTYLCPHHMTFLREGIHERAT